MLMDIKKSTPQYLKSVFEPLNINKFKDFVFWIRNRDMSKQIYTSSQYKNIWQRDADILFDIPLLWLDYLAMEHRHVYMKQLQERHEHNYLDHQKNFVLYQIDTPDNDRRYLVDQCYRCQSKEGESYIVGVSLNTTAELWHFQLVDRSEALGENGKIACKAFFSILKQVFGIVPFNQSQAKASLLVGESSYLALQKFALSKRELECLNHFCQGKTYKQTAREMSISPRTVETHLENILDKTHCNSKIEVVSRFSHVFLTL